MNVRFGPRADIGVGFIAVRSTNVSALLDAHDWLDEVFGLAG